MTDVIIRTSGSYALNLNGETAVVSARAYHLASTTGSVVTNASLTLLPGNWVAAATQSDPDTLTGNTLRTLVRHVVNTCGPLRIADDGNVPGILEGIVLTADDGEVSYGPSEDRDQDIARSRTR